MKKEIIVVIIAFALIIIGEVFTSSIIDKDIKNISDKLESLKTDINDDNKDKIKNNLEEINKNWERDTKTLSLFVEHKELEQVGMQLSSINSLTKTKAYSDSLNEIERLLSLLNNISEKQDVKLKNIF